MSYMSSNDDASQLGIYGAVAGVGIAGGAALAVRGSSPIYQKDKKGKKDKGGTDKAKDASVADNVANNTENKKENKTMKHVEPTQEQLDKWRSHNEKIRQRQGQETAAKMISQSANQNLAYPREGATETALHGPAADYDRERNRQIRDQRIGAEPDAQRITVGDTMSSREQSLMNIGGIKSQKDLDHFRSLPADTQNLVMEAQRHASTNNYMQSPTPDSRSTLGQKIGKVGRMMSKIR